MHISNMNGVKCSLNGNFKRGAIDLYEGDSSAFGC